MLCSLLFLEHETSSELLIQLSLSGLLLLLLRRWQLCDIIGVAHTKKCINCLILVTIDALEDGQSMRDSAHKT